jgi:hypothetical protein
VTFRWRPATQADLTEVLRLVRALADYERLPDHFVATEAQYQAAFFGASPAKIPNGVLAGFRNQRGALLLVHLSGENV